MRTLSVTLIASTLILAVAGSALAEPSIVGREVTYSARGVELKGYLAYDENIKIGKAD